ncbi:MAG: cyclic nucleotide-binding domain-containing protein [Burkholderiales bacterium]|nr:cyclic nucleotide-binding domain-containing protein [Burkholderiales bacterium]MDE1929083.1 cyclic nucleotide-binding domain-containing protein [Burkholderiales bacterium]MDE2157879.1 cyclic nucleotide-binding domain-containing protein [Burkholderiales bacterium]MDE2505094.1 cyclic nucleotide-binding domain-containing protein [Burkholderiales bacterium]
MVDESAAGPSTATILSQTPFFARLTPAQCMELAALAQREELDEGAPIYHLGDQARDLYVLVRGMVRLTIGYGVSSAGTGDILRRGDVFGWAAMTPACNARIATASCVTPCSILKLRGDGLLELMERDHTLGYRLMTQLTGLITGTLTAYACG